MALKDYSVGDAVEIIIDGQWYPATIVTAWSVILGYLIARPNTGLPDVYVGDPDAIRRVAPALAIGAALTLKADNGAEITGTAAAMGSGFVVIALDPSAM